MVAEAAPVSPKSRWHMSTWLTITVAVAIVIIVPIIRAMVLRAIRKRQPKQIEKPNSYYTPKLVLDRDSRNLWRAIPLELVHEINRDEVRRLVEKVDALGIDSLSTRERIFLDRMVELYPPPAAVTRPAPSRVAEEAFWADPFGFERRLGHGEANR